MSTKYFDPSIVISKFSDIATWSTHKLGDGPWVGTAVTRDERQLELEELASSWKVTDVSAEKPSSSSASSLELALKKAGLR